METLLVTIGILLVGLISFSKIKTLLFKNAQNELIKEDETLKTKENVLRNEIEDLKKQKNPDTLTPEQVEDFWKKK